ncbi:hypothetical protein [Spirosoma gilvum]
MYEVETHQLLTQLQTIYWDLMEIGPVDQTPYYRSRIDALELAHQRVSHNIEDCQQILDEFASELTITRGAITQLVSGKHG